MASQSESVLVHSDYSVGWACALPKEQTAAIAMLDDKHPDLSVPSSDPNTYTLGSIGKHNVVIACLPKGSVDTNIAATTALWMISTFPSIRFLLMVGIGGGIPPNVRLGDVVVGTPTGKLPGVIQCKIEEENRVERVGSLNNPPSLLLTALTKLATEHELHGSKIPEYLDELKQKYPRLAPKYLRSNSLEDQLFKAECDHVDANSTVSPDSEDEEKSCRLCNKDCLIERKSREMRVHYGLIASGELDIRSGIRRDQLNQDLGGSVLCVEMEAAGLMNSFPCIVIRGICDYVDSHKNKDWTEHAAAVAAAFAKEVLSVLSTREVEQLPTIKSSGLSAL